MNSLFLRSSSGSGWRWHWSAPPWSFRSSMSRLVTQKWAKRRPRRSETTGRKQLGYSRKRARPRSVSTSPDYQPPPAPDWHSLTSEGDGVVRRAGHGAGGEAGPARHPLGLRRHFHRRARGSRSQPGDGPSGRRYALVAAVPRRLARTETGPWDLGIRILLIVTTAGLVCYGLARYLTAPLIKIRGATRKFAQGELDTRVGASVGKRADEYGDLAQDFDLMADRMQQLVVSQRRLLGDISHELRSPLSRLGVAVGAARKNAGEEAAGYLSRIEIEAERMNQLIGQLLTLSRLESQDPKATRIDR